MKIAHNLPYGVLLSHQTRSLNSTFIPQNNHVTYQRKRHSQQRSLVSHLSVLTL